MFKSSYHIRHVSRLCRTNSIVQSQSIKLSFFYNLDKHSKHLKKCSSFSTNSSYVDQLQSEGVEKTVTEIMKHNLRGRFRVGGWIRSARHHKKMSFLHLSDGLSEHSLQVVIPAEARGDSTRLKYGAAIVVTGEVADSPARGQKEELLVEKVNHIGLIDHNSYPFAVNTRTYDAEYTRAYLHLRSKQPEFAAMMRLRSKCKKLINDYFHERMFVQIDTPVLTSNDCEGAGDTFGVSKRLGDKKYFGDDATVNLTVSGQLHLEACNSGNVDLS